MTQITYDTVYTQGLADTEASARFEQALAALRGGGPLDCPHVVDGERIAAGAPILREDPTDPSRIVAHTYEGGPELVRNAVDGARQASVAWRQTSLGERCAIMEEASRRLAERRIELAALMTHEVGKTRADTLAEIDECGVIFDLFVRQMLDNDGYRVPMAAPLAGAEAYVLKRPYGVFGVIPPFNFPMAIATAMAGAALLTGNAVVYKPSALTPGCGQAWFELFDGLLPTGVLQLVHGDAETGRALSESTVDGIAFTGSAEVGLALAERMNEPPYMRPLIAEMGGKNPAIVTASAGDVAAAAQATARAAYGLTGQKCVSCSRAIVTADVHDEFLAQLTDYVAKLKVGDPIDPAVMAGPLVKRASHERFGDVMDEVSRAGAIVAAGGSAGDPDEGYYADLTVVDGLPIGHRLTRDELFLPVLTVTTVDDFDAAIAEANSVVYGLSSGIYTEDPDEQRRYLDEIETGIVFINNPGGSTTGIWPGNQTMAGWKATGSTGNGGFGPLYLTQYMREQSRTTYPSMRDAARSSR